MSAPVSPSTQIGSAHAEVRNALPVKRGRQPGRLLIDGVWAHRAALDADATFEAFFFVPELLHSAEAQALDDQCRRRTSNSHQVSSKIIDRLSERNRPDGLVSIIEQPRWTLDRIRLPPAALIVVADGLQSPGNLGTVIRTIDACRADLLLVTDAPTRPDSEKVFQGDCGLRLSLTIPQLIVDDPATAIDWLHAWSVGRSVGRSR